MMLEQIANDQEIITLLSRYGVLTERKYEFTYFLEGDRDESISLGYVDGKSYFGVYDVYTSREKATKPRDFTCMKQHFVTYLKRAITKCEKEFLDKFKALGLKRH